MFCSGKLGIAAHDPDQMQVNHTKERYNSNLATKQASYYHQVNFQNKTEGIVEQ